METTHPYLRAYKEDEAYAEYSGYLHNTHEQQVLYVRYAVDDNPMQEIVLQPQEIRRVMSHSFGPIPFGQEYDFKVLGVSETPWQD